MFQSGQQLNWRAFPGRGISDVVIFEEYTSSGLCKCLPIIHIFSDGRRESTNWYCGRIYTTADTLSPVQR